MPRLSDRALHLIVPLGVLALYLPFAGTYGLWDPWESHYAEVARQIVVRGDWIQLFWDGAPWDGPEFWSKPVLPFWAMALAFKASAAPTSLPGLLTSWTAEWAARLPSIGFAALAVWSLFYVSLRLAGRRVALLAALACATSPMFFLVARQAITDMPLVGCLCAATALGAVALWDEEAQGPAPAVLLWAARALAALLTVPLLAHAAWTLGPSAAGSRWTGVTQVLPWALATAWLLLRLWRRPSQAALLFALAGVFTGLALLAKGLLAFLPALVLLLALLLTGGLSRLARKDIGTALLACALVGLPWFHFMGFLYGEPYLKEFIIEHHFGRVTSGFGSFWDATWVAYVRQLGYGAFPWGPLAVVGLAVAGRGTRRPLAMVAVLWASVLLALLTTSYTRYHHYALPMIPALALLAALALDDLLAGEMDGGPALAAVACAAVPLAGLALRDLVGTPSALERLVGLFDYSYAVPELIRWPGEVDLALPVYALGMGALAGLALMAVRLSRLAGMGLLAASMVGLTVFVLDVMIPRIAPHYTTRHVVEQWHRRRAPGERLLAWTLFTRGDTFYTANDLWDPARPVEDRGVFHTRQYPARKIFHGWLRRHANERVWLMTWEAGIHLKRPSWWWTPFAETLPPESLRSMRQQFADRNHVLFTFVARPPAPSQRR